MGITRYSYLGMLNKSRIQGGQWAKIACGVDEG